MLLPTAIPDEYRLNACDKVIIRTIRRDNDWLVKELEGKQFNVEKAWQKRLSEIQGNVKKESQEMIALVEIGKPDDYKENDPKLAVREGLRRAGRLSQFIHGLSKETAPKTEIEGEERSRVLNAALDLLTDAGFLRGNLDDIVADNNIIAVDIVYRTIGNRKEYLPILMWFTGEQLRVRN